MLNRDYKILKIVKVKYILFKTITQINQRGDKMKPIFKEEIEFLKEYNIFIPNDSCWKDGMKIYLDATCKKPLLELKVENHKLIVKKDNSKYFKNYKPKSIQGLIIENEERLNELEKKTIELIKNYINTHKEHKFVLNHSGGKDSSVLYYIWNKAISEIKGIEIDWHIAFFNTSNDTADTYKFIKALPIEKLRIINPKKGFYQWIIEDKKYFIPSTLVRNCCSHFKEGQVVKFYDLNTKHTMVLGVRKHESYKRSNYEVIMDSETRKKIHKTDIYSENWIMFAPIIDWTDVDIWLYVIKNNIEVNPQYYRGFNRCGCLICPYQSDYVDLLIKKFYPKQWERWEKILEKNYEITHVKERLKWTLEEWKHGKWKQGTGKEYEIINKKKTKERIKELAEIKGISEEIAEKYFNKTCPCGKKLNPTEIAMFLKLFGRYENQEDNRQYLCKKCLCQKLNITTNEYKEMIIKFRDEGCNLF